MHQTSLFLIMNMESIFPDSEGREVDVAGLVLVGRAVSQSPLMQPGEASEIEHRELCLTFGRRNKLLNHLNSAAEV